MKFIDNEGGIEEEVGNEKVLMHDVLKEREDAGYEGDFTYAADDDQGDILANNEGRLAEWRAYKKAKRVEEKNEGNKPSDERLKLKIKFALLRINGENDFKISVYELGKEEFPKATLAAKEAYERAI